MAYKPKENPLPHSERGMIGARRRWGPPRNHNIADLSPEQREIVNALIEAQRKANEIGGER